MFTHYAVCDYHHTDSHPCAARNLRAMLKRRGYRTYQTNGIVATVAPREIVEALLPDILTRTHTAFRAFTGLLDAQGNYRPSLKTSRSKPLALLTDQYDAAQTARGDARRAYRY